MSACTLQLIAGVPLQSNTGNNQNQGQITLSLSVSSAYPNNGANWTDYVKNDGPDLLSGTDTACAGTETGFAACIHGGQMRKVIIPGVSSCSGLTLTDALGVFVWTCAVQNGTATFFSTDFQTGKGLGHLLNATSWKNNSVSLSSTAYVGTSPSAAWWSNPISALPDNHLVTDSPVALGATAGTIYTLASSRATEGYSFSGGKLAMVVLPGATLSYGGRNNPAWCDGNAIAVICPAASLKFLWIEGSIDAYSGGGTDSDFPIYGDSINFSRLHLVSIKNATSEGIHLRSVTNSTIDQVATSNNGSNGFQLSSSTGNLIKRLVAASNGTGGIYLSDTSGSPSSSNVFYQISVGNNAQAAMTMQGSTGNTVVQLVMNNNTTGGLSLGWNSVSGNTITEVTSINDSNGGGGNAGVSLQTGGLGTTNHNTFNGIVTANTYVGLDISGASSANNTISQAVFAHSFAYGISVNANNNKFTGNLIFGNNASGDCLVSGGTSPGIINTTCTDTGTDGSSSYTGQLSNAVARFSRTLASSLVGKVTATDPTNASNTNGTAAYPGTPRTFDFADFSSFFRGWGVDGSAFPNSNNVGRWSSGTGRIWDLRLKASDTAILGTSGNGSATNVAFIPGATCPTAVDGSISATDQSGRTYLLNAFEIVDPASPGYNKTGNHNGLCEAGESCIYAPNFGAYQGEGTLQPCNFHDGSTVTGVHMYGYVTNGV